MALLCYYCAAPSIAMLCWDRVEEGAISATVLFFALLLPRLLCFCHAIILWAFVVLVLYSIVYIL